MNKIIHGECSEILRRMRAECIDLTVTSPPYDDLRNYQGYKFNFPPIARELYRVTKPGGVVVWVVADATVNGSETGTSFRQALYFRKIGFNLHDTMIFRKINTLPQVKTNRYTSAFEYMFVLSKGPPKTFNPKMKPNKNAGAVATTRGISRTEDRKVRKVVVNPMGLESNVWDYAVGNSHDGSRGHPAPFPVKLAVDHILTWTNRGDVVLDPMCGSGTTPAMAKLHGRRFLGIEMGEKYFKHAQRRVNSISKNLFTE